MDMIFIYEVLGSENCEEKWASGQMLQRREAVHVQTKLRQAREGELTDETG